LGRTRVVFAKNTKEKKTNEQEKNSVKVQEKKKKREPIAKKFVGRVGKKANWTFFLFILG